MDGPEINTDWTICVSDCVAQIYNFPRSLETPSSSHRGNARREDAGTQVTGPTASEHLGPLGRTPQQPEISWPALLLQPQGGMAGSHGRVLLFPKYVCCINTIVKCKPSVGDGGVGARAGRGSVPDHGQPHPARPGSQCGGGEVLHPITLSGRTDPTFFKLHLAGTI